MANRSDPFNLEVHGTNAQRLVEKILRTKIYASPYWKEACFGLTAETLVDRAIELTYIGGTYGGTRKPTKFMCLLLKMLQIQPEFDVVVEFVKSDEYKYVRCLGALYLRCTARPEQVYKFLEPLYADYAKIRVRTFEGWSVIHVDEFVDELLTSDYSCDIALPHLPRRWHLEAQHQLAPRAPLVSEGGKDEEEDDMPVVPPRPPGDTDASTRHNDTMLSSSASSAFSSSAERRSRRSSEAQRAPGEETQQTKKKKKKKKTEGEGTLFKKKRPRSPSPPEDDAVDDGRDQRGADRRDDSSLDVAATNALRAKLGLKPLR